MATGGKVAKTCEPARSLSTGEQLAGLLYAPLRGLGRRPQMAVQSLYECASPNSREASMDVIKVSANSRTSAVAGAIAGVIREHKHAEVQAIGAGAVNQAIKALVLATGYLRGDGIEVACVPEFVDVAIDDKVRTAIKLVVEPLDRPREVPEALEPPEPPEPPEALAGP